MLLTKSIYLFIIIHISAVRGNSERETDFNSVLNFILKIRNNSSTVWEYVATIQALLCPEQPVCTRDGIQDRNTTLSALPSILNIGTKKVRILEIPEFIGICCLPCSCSENCEVNGYCCMSREVFFRDKATDENSDDAAADDASDDIPVNDTNSDAFLNDVSDNTSMDDRSGGTLLKNTTDDDFQNDSMASKVADSADTTDAILEDPVESDCIAAHMRSYISKDYFVPYNTYFMVTRCFKDNSNDTINEKCQHPRYDRIEETVPVTSLKTNQTYWNTHCAICNNDADDVVQWNAAAGLSPEFYYFANSSRPKTFPQTIDDLHEMLVHSYEGITYTPATDAEQRICLPKRELLSCSRYENSKDYNRKASMANYCRQFYNPVTFNIQGLTRFYWNPFCIFCVTSQIHPARNAVCAARDGDKNSEGLVKGLLDYRKEQNLDDTATGHDSKVGKCRCTEVEDPYLGICRPAFCAVGSIWMLCRCAQPIKVLSGIRVRLFLKLMPGPGLIDVTTDTQIRKLKMTVTRFMQNTVENTKADIPAISHMKSDSSEYFVCMVILWSNPGYDTKETMKPLLKYLDKNSTQDINIGKTKYAIQFTTRALVWSEYIRGQGTKLKLKDLDNGIYNTSTFQTGANPNHVFQPLSPLLYCKQIQLNASEYTEVDGQVSINTTWPPFSLPYYYRIENKQIRVCLGHYLERSSHLRKNKGTSTNYTFMSITGLLMFLIVTYYGIV